MKNSIVSLSLIFLFFIVVEAFGQHQIGFLGGLNFASNRTGIGIGGVLDLRLSNILSLRMEPMYLQKGANATDSNLGIIEGEFKLDYLELPLLLKFVLDNKTIRPYVITGPTVGYKVSSKYSLISTGSLPGIISVEDRFKSIDFGIGIGGGVNFQTGRNIVFLEGRYVLGLYKVFDDTFEYFGKTELEANTKGFQLMGGVTFPLQVR